MSLSHPPLRCLTSKGKEISRRGAEPAEKNQGMGMRSSRRSWRLGVKLPGFKSPLREGRPQPHGGDPRQPGRFRPGGPKDSSPRREPWDPRPERSRAPAGRKTREAPMRGNLTRRREDAKETRRCFTQRRRDRRGECGHVPPPGSCLVNANNVQPLLRPSWPDGLGGTHSSRSSRLRKAPSEAWRI